MDEKYIGSIEINRLDVRACGLDDISQVDITVLRADKMVG
jgi:hypothetical protein